MIEEVPSRRASTRALLLLLAAAALAAAIRGAVTLVPGRLISRDGIHYAILGMALRGGKVGTALAHDYPPGYPVAVAAAGGLFGARSELEFAQAAIAVSLVAGALSVIPAYAIGRRLAIASASGRDPAPPEEKAVRERGRAAGLGAALLAALHARHAEASADALSEPLFALLLLGALAAAVESGASRRPIFAGLFGGLAAAAFLVRPEGALALAALPLALRGRDGRLFRAAAALAPLALLALPYVVWMSDQMGALTLSKKKDPFALVRGALAAPGQVAAQAAWNLAKAWEAGPFAMAFGAAGAALAMRRASGRREAAALGIVFALLLFAYATVRVDRRFGLVLSLVALPLGAVALGSLRAGARRTALGAVAVLSAALIAHEARPTKGHYLECAVAVRAAADRAGIERPRVACYDPRIAFYARGTALGEKEQAEADFVIASREEAATSGAPEATPAGFVELARFEPSFGRGRSLVLYCAARLANGKGPPR